MVWARVTAVNWSIEEVRTKAFALPEFLRSRSTIKEQRAMTCISHCIRFSIVLAVAACLVLAASVVPTNGSVGLSEEVLAAVRGANPGHPVKGNATCAKLNVVPGSGYVGVCYSLIDNNPCVKCANTTEFTHADSSRLNPHGFYVQQIITCGARTYGICKSGSCNGNQPGGDCTNMANYQEQSGYPGG